MNQTAQEQQPSMQEEPIPAPQEYETVILTIDHTSTRKDDHVVQKYVASTQSLTSAMLSLFGYYDEDHLLHSEATIALFQRAAQNPACAFVYRTRDNIQVVMTAATFETLVAISGGSILAGTSRMLDMAGEMIVANEQAARGPIPLSLLEFEVGPMPAPAPAPAPAKEAPAKRTRRKASTGKAD